MDPWDLVGSPTENSTLRASERNGERHHRERIKKWAGVCIVQFGRQGLIVFNHKELLGLVVLERLEK